MAIAQHGDLRDTSFVAGIFGTKLLPEPNWGTLDGRSVLAGTAYKPTTLLFNGPDTRLHYVIPSGLIPPPAERNWILVAGIEVLRIDETVCIKPVDMFQIFGGAYLKLDTDLLMTPQYGYRISSDIIIEVLGKTEQDQRCASNIGLFQSRQRHAATTN